ncbi:MAG: LuxR C-terminal-related transcriptional regulator [Proteobacteria bacterium]|nr:LuxR C-terminal-related transcriptional regulator [Pseudomonadota bacterium]
MTGKHAGTAPINIKVYVNGILVDEHDLLQGTLRIGRHTDNDVILRSNRASRYHCRLEWREGKLFLIDTSKNGTFINGINVRGQSEVMLGDVITIHPYTLLMAPIDVAGAARTHASPEESDTVFVVPGSNLQRDFLEKNFEITHREYEIIEYVLMGRHNKDISEILHISEFTVKTHLRNIFEKLQVESRTQLIAKITAMNYPEGAFDPRGNK